MDVKALSVVWIHPPEGEEKEYWWNIWYNAKHGPERFTLPGFLAFRRFEQVPNMPKDFAIAGEYKYFSMYDLKNSAVQSTKGYEDLIASNRAEGQNPKSGEALHGAGGRWVADNYDVKFVYPEKEYDPPYADYILVMGHDVPDDKEKDFNAWCHNEYFPQVAKIPGFIAARHCKQAEGFSHPRFVHRTENAASPQHLTLYDFENAKAFESEAVKEPKEPSGVTRTKCQLYKRFYPYKGFKYTSTLV
jgi:hypothetical protein